MADVALPDVSVTASAPTPTVSTLQAPYAVRKIDLTFKLGTGDFGVAGANQLTITGLKVYAHLDYVVSPHMSTWSTLRVYGMSLDHINQLSQAGLLYSVRNNRVMLKAGDEVSGMTTVADGIILEAYPNFDGGADDAHFYIVANGAADLQLKPVKPSSYPGSVPAADVLKTLAQQAGYTLQNNGVTAVLASPYFWGTTWQQIQSAVAAADCFAWIDSVNKRLIVWRKDGQSAPDASITVSKETGMIRYPMFQQSQIIVRTLFNPTLATGGPGTTVLVKSELKAANNAKLVINRVAHELASQMPGGPWETTIWGTPPSLGSKN